MGRERFDTNSIAYDDFILQTGEGMMMDQAPLTTYQYFRGSHPYQRGAGISDLLRGLWRILMPMVRRAGSTIGHEALDAGGRILDKVVEGGNLKTAAMEEGKAAVDNVMAKMESKSKQMGGSVGKIYIKGGKKKRKNRFKFSTPQRISIIGKEVLRPLPPPDSSINSNPLTEPSIPLEKKKKRERRDAFGLF